VEFIDVNVHVIMVHVDIVISYWKRNVLVVGKERSSHVERSFVVIFVAMKYGTVVDINAENGVVQECALHAVKYVEEP